ncbi:hypothetical protein [Neorhizobium sp. DAR64860/K0K1]|uniref:hypothetical protein n=1 Tax=Neorhizobium sp. DAR64860/K0K1 TaxID=3421955 RepID=UPI003D2D8DCD
MSTGGLARFEIQSIRRRDKQFYLDQIAVCLGGIAAERLVLGTKSNGAGGDDRSDLGMATRLATLVETQSGMSESLRFRKATSED